MAGEIIYDDGNVYYVNRDKVGIDPVDLWSVSKVKRASAESCKPENYCKECNKLAYPDWIREAAGTCRCEPCPQPFSTEEYPIEQKDKSKRPRTIGELLESLPDLREAHPTIKPERLSDQPTKEEIFFRRLDIGFYIAFTLGALAVLWFAGSPFIAVSVMMMLTFLLIGLV